MIDNNFQRILKFLQVVEEHVEGNITKSLQRGNFYFFRVCECCVFESGFQVTVDPTIQNVEIWWVRRLGDHIHFMSS